MDWKEAGKQIALLLFCAAGLALAPPTPAL